MNNYSRIFKLALFVLASGIISPSAVWTQYSEAVFDLKKAQDLYDERGFSKGAAISVDGKLAVNNQNGGVTYSYPISSFTSGGHPVNVTLNYCGAVQFTCFKDYNLSDRNQGQVYSGWSRFHQNRPAWIMGVNGWAVNMIGVTTHFHAEPGSDIFNTSHNNFDDNDVIWLADGYDFSNRMRDFGAVAQTEPYYDVIRLLRADGSVMELMNVHTKTSISNGNPDTCARLYTGTYFVNEANSRSYGVVEYATDFMPGPVHDYLVGNVAPDDRHPVFPRILKFYPGDGTEVIFRERIAPYGMSAYTDDENRSGGLWGHPTIFYLEQIKSNGGIVVNFQRARHYSEHGGSFLGVPDLTRGRALTTSFTGHEIRFGYNSMIVEALGRTTKIKFDTVMRSGNAASTETMPFANLGVLSPMSEDLRDYDEENPALYKSFLGQVTQIIDPEDRVTTFGYEKYSKTYQNFGFPHSSGTTSFLLKNYRLKSVTEPTAQYALKYYGNLSETITSATSGWDDPKKLNNMVDSVRKYDADGTLLTSDHYIFHDAGSIGLGLSAYTEQTTFDHLNGQSRTTQFSYAKFDLNNYVPILSPSRHTVLVTTIQNASGVQTVTQTAYATGNEVPAWGASGTFTVLPTSQTTEVNGIAKSHQQFTYQLDTLRKVWETDDLAAKYGMEITTKTTKTLQPNDISKVLLSNTTTYLHLPMLDTTVTWTESGWDKLKSLQNFFYLRDTVQDPAVVGKRWEEVMLRAPVAVFETDTLTDYVRVPPIYGLEERSVTTDSTGAVTGKRNVYVSDILEGNQRALRGKLVADSILGSSGERILKGEYRYRREWTGDLPAAVRNALGVETRYSYGYSFCDGLPFWEECSFTPPSGIVVANDSTTRNYDLLWSPLAYWYGKPAAEQQIVRRYDASGNPSPDTLRTYNERTYYGQVAATVEPNGYLSQYQYDYNGRLNVGWLPRDFPSMLDTTTYEGAAPIDLYGTTHHHRRVDSIHCEDAWDELTDSTYIVSTHITGPVLHTVNHDTLYASWPVTSVPDCPPLSGSSSAAARKKGGDRQMQAIYERTLPYNQYAGYKGFFGVLSHVLDSASALKNALRLDSLKLEVMITSIDPECVHLEVVIDSIFTKTFVHNCSGPGQGTNGTSRSKDGRSRELQGGGLTAVAGGYKLTVDLSSVAAQLQGRANGSLLNIELRVKTPGATVAFINGTNAEDLRPRLNVYGQHQKVWDQADYTVAYEHDDAGRTTTVTGKVDDARHTINDLVSQGVFARRGTSKNFFGADYRTLKSERTVVESDTTGAFVTRVDTTRQKHTGLGAQLRTIDAEGDSVTTNYDALGRPVQMINTDGTVSTITYMHARPDSLGITDQDFFGYCDVKITANETGMKVAQFTDALGRLRREVSDYGPGPMKLNLTTKYEYDLLGRLKEVTNPKGQVTTYTHDEFGRVKSKTQVDIGTISYTYDDLGNVRFSQNSEQAAKGLLTFNQYDDLNRLTLVGEAYIDDESECGPYNEDNPSSGGCGDGTRLTDKLDGNVLHIGIPTPTVTANPTMYQTPITDGPSFTSLGNFKVRNCGLNLEPRLGETSAPVGPFVMHPRNLYRPLNNGNGIYGVWSTEFEDVHNYPEFVRMAVQYDEMPPTSGAAWRTFPAWEKWNVLAPTGTVRNLKGREVAVAYRDKAAEPFHYAVMSYDERGRVEALLHYNENLGFDAVYYQYNSANQIIAITVADPFRRFTTWYGYDQQGRRDSVWTRLDAAGSGLLVGGNFNNLHFPGFASKQGIDPEIVYSYTKLDRVQTMKYPAIDVLVEYAYNRRKFIDSIVATGGVSPIFTQRLEYDATGQITAQEYQHGAGANKRQEYEYDRVQRLTSWELDGITTGYEYDEIGNRQQVTRTGEPAQPYWYWGSTNQLWSRDKQDAYGNDTTHAYAFNANGAMTSQQVTYNTPWLSSLLRQENFGYSFRGLMNRATVRDIVQGVPKPWEDWRYRYNAGGEREQKRLYPTTSGVVPAPDSVIYPWVYYLLGGKQQLAVYHGQQFDSTATRCGDGGLNRVYMYPFEYLSYGTNDVGMLITRPSGTKEYKVVDHLGSTRTILDSGGTVIGSYDNEPFGAPLAVTGADSRKGFIDKETDRETNSGNYGVRQYDAEVGRFWSTDALWEKFSSETPYNYSFNNPLRFVDPTGVEPDTIGEFIDAAVEKGKEVVTDIINDEIENYPRTLTENLCPPCGATLKTIELFTKPKESGIAIAINLIPMAPGFVKRQVARYVANVTIRRFGTVYARNVKVDLKPTLERINRGGSHPHYNDGTVFRNAEGRLPSSTDPNYYREYVHPTPGISDAGPQRVVVGRNGETYYSPDHYDTFIPIHKP